MFIMTLFYKMIIKIKKYPLQFLSLLIIIPLFLFLLNLIKPNNQYDIDITISLDELIPLDAKIIGSIYDNSFSNKSFYINFPDQIRTDLYEHIDKYLTIGVKEKKYQKFYKSRNADSINLKLKEINKKIIENEISLLSKNLQNFLIKSIDSKLEYNRNLLQRDLESLNFYLTNGYQFYDIKFQQMIDNIKDEILLAQNLNYQSRLIDLNFKLEELLLNKNLYISTAVVGYNIVNLQKLLEVSKNDISYITVKPDDLQVDYTKSIYNKKRMLLSGFTALLSICFILFINIINLYYRKK